MSDDVVSFNQKRAELAEDCRLWTVRDALMACVKAIEDGKIEPNIVYIALGTSKPGRVTELNFYAAGGSRMELVGLLATHMHDNCSGG